MKVRKNTPKSKTTSSETVCTFWLGLVAAYCKTHCSRVVWEKKDTVTRENKLAHCHGTTTLIKQNNKVINQSTGHNIPNTTKHWSSPDTHTHTPQSVFLRSAQWASMSSLFQEDCAFLSYQWHMWESHQSTALNSLSATYSYDNGGGHHTQTSRTLCVIKHRGQESSENCGNWTCS